VNHITKKIMELKCPTLKTNEAGDAKPKLKPNKLKQSQIVTGRKIMLPPKELKQTCCAFPKPIN
jgi:hypothetical protein